MAKLEKQKQKLERMMDALVQEQAKVLAAEQAEKRRLAREAAKQRAKERAALFRSADAHRKIVLGGLVIASETDDWNEAEIVGALLIAAERVAQQPGIRAALKEKGIRHLEARKAAREVK